MQNHEIKIQLSLVQAIAQYLGTRPYNEVSGLIKSIEEQAAPQLNQEKTEA